MKYEFGYFVERDISPNGTFALKWGANKTGKAVLYEDRELILKVNVTRPGEGKVADTGVFIIVDGSYKGDELGCRFLAFSKNGKNLINLPIEAYIFSTDLSKSGKYAVCQTANNPDSEDGFKLFFFNLESGKLLWKKEPETTWSKHFEIDEERCLLFIIPEKRFKYRYSFDGVFLDTEKLISDTLEYGNGYRVYRVAKSVCEGIIKGDREYSEYQRLIISLENALLREEENEPKSLIFRGLAEIHLNIGDDRKALENFKNALLFNPKVGVKRQISKLEKSLGVNK